MLCKIREGQGTEGEKEKGRELGGRKGERKSII